MDMMQFRAQTLTSALFVDFDNIYSCLVNLDPAAAERFALEPQRWLRWLERDLPAPLGDTAPMRRRIVLRHCYLNPQAFARFRTGLSHAGIEVIDCPPLTHRGKTAADLRLALGVVDALAHSTRFDEFIVLSADADFTPLLHRVRAHDRLTTVLAVGPTAGAYRAAADAVVTESMLIQALLDTGVPAEAVAVSPPRQPACTLEFDGASVEPPASDAMLCRLAEQLVAQALVRGSLSAVDVREIYRDSPEVSGSTTWLGYGSLRGLTEALVQRHPELQLVPETPWHVTLRGVGSLQSPAPKLDAAETDNAELRTAVSEWIVARVRRAPAPIVLATLAAEVRLAFPVVHASAWLGTGRFKTFLEGLDLGGLYLAPVVPGYIYDPERHVAPGALLQCSAAA